MNMEKSATITDIAPYIAEIVDDFCKMAEPDSKFHAQSEFIIEAAELFRSSLADCCAFHRVSDIALIDIGLKAVVDNCNCDDTLQHETIAAMVECIHRHMSECMSEVMTKLAMLARRN